MLYLDFPTSLFSLSQTIQMLYYFSRYMVGLFTVQCVYFYKSNSDKIRTAPPSQVELAKEASQFQNTFWENHDLTEQQVIAYIYLGYAYCFLYFSNRVSLMDQKPN